MRKQVTAGDLKIDNEYEYVHAGGDARCLGTVVYVGRQGSSYYVRHKESKMVFQMPTLSGYLFSIEPPIEKLDTKKYGYSIEAVAAKLNEVIDRINS